MKRTLVWAAAIVLVLTGAAFAHWSARTCERRADCPGKIFCPLTGEEICRDACPLGSGSTGAKTTAACCAKGR